MAMRIEIAPLALAELGSLRPFDGRRVAAAIDGLAHQPLVETRSRKPLRAPLVPAWELRVGAFRVMYEVEAEVVRVLRIVRKGRKTTGEAL
jgi:mRNA-degrading endonuclease RelE of RelBE toxin-antitoxin system